MADKMTLYNPSKTLNEALADLGYRSSSDPCNRVGVKMILAAGDVEVFRGRAGEIWTWLRKCPDCEFRGYIEPTCSCDGTGVRSYFRVHDQQAGRGAA